MLLQGQFLTTKPDNANNNSRNPSIEHVEPGKYCNECQIKLLTLLGRPGYVSQEASMPEVLSLILSFVTNFTQLQSIQKISYQNVAFVAGVM